MISTEERIRILEQKVAQLEQTVKTLSKTETTAKANFISKIKMTSKSVSGKHGQKIAPFEQYHYKSAVQKTNHVQEKQSKQNIIAKPQPNKPNSLTKLFNNKETLVGKYIIGALAALLLFVGASSFVVMIWDLISPVIKLATISIVGIALTALGFALVKKDKGNIASIILGSGAGVTYIAILSARMAFNFIDNNTAILLCGAWALFLILSSIYTNLFFTTIVAYIGSIIALLLGLRLATIDIDLMMLLVFITAISAVMLLTSKKKRAVQFITCLLLSMVSYTILLLFYQFGSSNIFTQMEGTIYSVVNMQVVILLIVYGLMNLLYYSIKDESANLITGIVSIITTILTFLVVLVALLPEYNLTFTVSFIIIMIFNLIQFMINTLVYKKVDLFIKLYYPLMIAITFVLVNLFAFYLWAGLSVVAVLLLIIHKQFGTKKQTVFINTLVLIDILLLLAASFIRISKPYIITVYTVIAMLVMAYSLLNDDIQQKSKTKEQTIIVFLLSCIIIPKDLLTIWLGADWSNLIGYILAVVLINVAFYFNYFASTIPNDNANQKNATSKITQLKSLFVPLIGALYAYGLINMTSSNTQTILFLYFLSTLAVVLLYTKSVFASQQRASNTIGITLIAKYLVLAWTFIYSSDYSVSPFVYTVIGLTIAVIAIIVGFKFSMNGLRRYGLILTIAMVAKFIVIDLNGENSIKRVVALIVGSILCFIISYIYNKLSARLEISENTKNSYEPLQ